MKRMSSVFLFLALAALAFLTPRAPAGVAATPAAAPAWDDCFLTPAGDAPVPVYAAMDAAGAVLGYLEPGGSLLAERLVVTPPDAAGGAVVWAKADVRLLGRDGYVRLDVMTWLSGCEFVRAGE